MGGLFDASREIIDEFWDVCDKSMEALGGAYRKAVPNSTDNNFRPQRNHYLPQRHSHDGVPRSMQQSTHNRPPPIPVVPSGNMLHPQDAATDRELEQAYRDGYEEGRRSSYHEERRRSSDAGRMRSHSGASERRGSSSSHRPRIDGSRGSRDGLDERSSSYRSTHSSHSQSGSERARPVEEFPAGHPLRLQEAQHHETPLHHQVHFDDEDGVSDNEEKRARRREREYA